MPKVEFFVFPSVFTNRLTSNPHTGLPSQLMGTLFLSGAQTKTIVMKPVSLFVASHILPPSGTPGGFVFGTGFRMQPTVTISPDASCGPITDTSYLDYSNRFLTGFSASVHPSLPHSPFSAEHTSDDCKIQRYLMSILCAKVSPSYSE